jgi:hypothetical protein
MFKIVTGDLMAATEMYICHQCNCISTRSAHLAYTMFKHYPHADIYSGRKKPNQPGTIKICGDGEKERFVIDMLGQYYPGKKYPNSKKDGKKAREGFFQSCLNRMVDLYERTGSGSFAFPWRIGCGAAGGDWAIYLAMLKNFEQEINPGNAAGAEVTIYRLPSMTPKDPKVEGDLF